MKEGRKEDEVKKVRDGWKEDKGRKDIKEERTEGRRPTKAGRKEAK